MIGRPRVHHRRTDSTNERARALAEASAPHGTVVTAGEQTAGRGRQGRSWLAAPGEALLVSVVVRDLAPRHALASMMAALAVCEAAEDASPEPVECAIKWPNDVWVRRRKISGILVEARPAAGWAIVGIGPNTGVRDFPPEIAEIAASLDLPAPEVALEPLLARLDRWLAAEPAEVLAAWRTRDALLGDRIAWDGGAGVARGVDETGALLVDTEAGERLALTAGEVHLRRAD